VNILLVRPCAGLERSLSRTLSSLPRQSHDLLLRVRFAVASLEDPAAPIAADAVASIREEHIPDVALLVTRAIGPNAKADQLARVIDEETEDAEIVVVADSDVDLTDFDLASFVEPLRMDSNVAAVWAPPIEVAPLTWGDHASAAILDSSLHSFALLGALDKGGMVGKLVALRRRDLDAVEGFAALRGYLGEDMELARRLLARGKRIVRHRSQPAHSLAAGRTLRAVIGRYVRWLMVIRAQRPHLLPSYPLFICLAPLLLVLAAVGKLGALAAVVVIARLAIALLARARSGSKRPLRTLLVDALVSDLVLLTAFVVVATKNPSFSWRGRELRIGRDGRLTGEVGSA